MELVRVVSHNTHKRMVSCLQGHIGADAEKRHVRGKNAYHSCSFPTVNCFRMWNVSHTTMESLFWRVHTHSRWFVFFSLPSALPKPRTTVRATPLYRKWSGKKTQNPRHSTSVVLGTACSISHSDVCCPYSRCMTLLPLGFSLQKQDVQNFISFPSQMWWKSIGVWA